MAQYKVEGLHCDGCAMSLKKAIKRQDASITVQSIDHKSGLVIIDEAAGDVAAKVAAAAADVGFTYVGPA
ncbi:MAG: heavy-metal-associated domain-containing protein [Alphaproteobacteria bacterium]|nr:heavy-metal-associated domain-containing protein [Alphaproteobacteria bacterium]